MSSFVTMRNCPDDPATLGAVGVAAYIFADLVHECLGHAVTCLITGGQVTLLTSVFFRSQPWSRITDVAGPSANLIAGGLLWIALSYGRRWSAQARLFLLVSMAFNLFWGTGYLIYSGAANTGDWASAVAGLHPLWLWRLILVVLGVASYGYSVRVVGVSLRPFVAGDEKNRARQLRRLVFIPYSAAGLAACLAALLYVDAPTAALADAFRETFLSNAGLLIIPLWSKRIRTTISAAPVCVTRKLRWVLTTAIALSVFAALMGRGLRFQH